MNVYCLQHVAPEDAGYIETWFRNQGCRFDYIRLYEGDAIPEPSEVEALVMMGGPMSVNDEEEFSWLAPEKRLIRSVIEAGRPVLGVCLGAQLMASAFGARVYPNRYKEIGWWPVEAMPVTPGQVFPFPETAEVFHWHGETFDLPPGAVHLARSEGCTHQAFQLGERAVGLQFHLEATPESARSLIELCRHEITPGPYVQAEAVLRDVSANAYLRINNLMARLLTYITRP